MEQAVEAADRWVVWRYSDDHVLPNAVRGDGVWAYDGDDNAYLDGSGGPTLFSLGYNHPEVCDAIRKQLDAIQFGFSAFFRTDAIDCLAEKLSTSSSCGLDNVAFVNSGSEAVEQALKLALQYHAAKGDAGRIQIISRERSWHGSTLGALSVSGFLQRRRAFENIALSNVSFLSPVNAYRPPEGVSDEDLAVHCALELEREILRLGPGKVAAFIFEPVVGAAGCVVPAPKGYAAKVREICSRYGVLMISDEVMCGVGRTGTWRALEHDGVSPDIMTIAKGLGGGYLPLGAALYRREIHDVIMQTYGQPGVPHTTSGHSLACAAAVAILNVIERDGLVEKCAGDGSFLQRRLQETIGDHPNVGDIRGRGLFWGVEFVKDKDTRKPFEPEQKVSTKIFIEASRNNGLFFYPVGGIIDGLIGDGALISPAYTISRDEIEQLVDRFQRSVETVLGE